MDKVKEDVNLLHDLIRQHDVIFLLTDSRESRWLPTVLASVEQKVRARIGNPRFPQSFASDRHVLRRRFRLVRDHPSRCTRRTIDKLVDNVQESALGRQTRLLLLQRCRRSR